MLDITKEIEKLKNNKSSGPDNLVAELFKCSATYNTGANPIVGDQKCMERDSD